MNLVCVSVGVLLLVIGAVSCTAVAPPSGTGGRQPLIGGLNVTQEERVSLEDSAVKGDATAASRLGRYYALVVVDDAIARKWYEMAAKNGGSSEKDELESFLDTRAE